MKAKTIPIDDAVLEQLKAAKVEGNKLFLVNKLHPSLYAKVNKVLDCLGGKWNRAAQAHIFPEDPWDAITEAVMAEAVVDWKQTYQFYATPHELARQVAIMAAIEPHHRVLEPSAGTGALLDHCLGRKFYCELNPKMAEDLQKKKGIGDFLQQDFLSLPVTPDYLYDRIVMNPPFCKGQDVVHVTKARDHLQQGGRLVAIMGPGWRFRTDPRHSTFRKMVENFVERGAGHWEEVDAGTFKDSGTMVKTTIVRLDAV